MYFRLGYEYPKNDDGGYYMVEDGTDFDGVKSWALGQPITGTLPNPIVVDLVPINDFVGAPPDMFDEYMCLMSKAMVEVLSSSGIDNIQTYPARLVDSVNAKEFDYYAVNILGLVAAADLGRSDWVNLDGPPVLDTYITDLSIDQGKAKGHSLFRLAEATGSILVDERVKGVLQAAGLNTLTFEPAGG